MAINDQMLCGWTSCENSAWCLPSHHHCPFSSLSLHQLWLQSVCSKCSLGADGSLTITKQASDPHARERKAREGKKGEEKKRKRRKERKGFLFLLLSSSSSSLYASAPKLEEIVHNLQVSRQRFAACVVPQMFLLNLFVLSSLLCIRVDVLPTQRGVILFRFGRELHYKNQTEVTARLPVRCVTITSKIAVILCIEILWCTEVKTRFFKLCIVFVHLVQLPFETE